MARKAGVREARQHLSALLEEVKQGREVEITERGTVVARLVPATVSQSKPFPGRASFRRGLPAPRRPLSSAVLADRKERG